METHDARLLMSTLRPVGRTVAGLRQRRRLPVEDRAPAVVERDFQALDAEMVANRPRLAVWNGSFTAARGVGGPAGRPRIGL